MFSVSDYEFLLASAPDDFTAFEIEVIFEPEESEKLIQVHIVDDEYVEDDESFLIILSIPTDAMGVQVTQDAARVTIWDDDCKYHCFILTLPDKYAFYISSHLSRISTN